MRGYFKLAVHHMPNMSYLGLGCPQHALCRNPGCHPQHPAVSSMSILHACCRTCSRACSREAMLHSHWHGCCGSAAVRCNASIARPWDASAVGKEGLPAGHDSSWVLFRPVLQLQQTAGGVGTWSCCSYSNTARHQASHTPAGTIAVTTKGAVSTSSAEGHCCAPLEHVHLLAVLCARWCAQCASGLGVSEQCTCMLTSLQQLPAHCLAVPWSLASR